MEEAGAAGGTTARRYRVYEVFAQAFHDAPHVHRFSLLAPDAEMALALARENFLRREPCINLWVVPREAIRATPYEDPDLFTRTDKSYRETASYRYLAKKWRRYRQDQLTEETVL